MLQLTSQALGAATTSSIAAAATPLTYFRWRVDIFHKSGGKKKSFFVGQDDSPLIGINFENNLKGCGAGSLTFSNLDFPIDADDYVLIYFKGTLYYRGIVDITPDPKGGECTLIPAWNRFDKTLHNEAFTTKTIAQIMQTVIEAHDQDTGILWNALLVDTGSSTTYTITYSYENITKIFDDLVDGRLSGRHWGVDKDNYFFCLPLGTSVADVLYYGDKPAYTDITVERDYQGIEATRYQVFKKTSAVAGTATRIGQVGYSAPYPPLEIEKLVKIKEDRITAPEVLSDTLALDWAYAKLGIQQVKETITLNNVDLDRYEPTIGDKITAQDVQNNVLYTIVNCDSTTGWTSNCSLDTTDFCEGTASIKATLTTIGQIMTYTFTGQKIYYYPEKLGMMIKSTQSGQYLRIVVSYDSTYTLYGYSSGSYSDGPYSEGDSVGPATSSTTSTWIINLTAASIWQYFSVESTSPISSISLEAYAAVPSGTAQVNIDRIQLYGPYRNIYTDNVVQAQFSINTDSEKVQVKLNNYDPQANQTLFELETSVKILEAVTAI